MDDNIYSVLSSDTTLSDYVSGRILPDVPKTDIQLPMITYTRVSTNPEYKLNGGIAITTYEFQIDLWALTKTEIDPIADRIEFLLRDYHNSPSVQWSFLESRTQAEEQQTEGALFHCVQIYRVIA